MKVTRGILPISGLAATNSSPFRGCKTGTLLLARWWKTRESAELVFRHRENGFLLQAEDMSFPVYDSINFKYFIRALHRQGCRKVSIKIQRENKFQLAVWLDNKGQVV